MSTTQASAPLLRIRRDGNLFVAQATNALDPLNCASMIDELHRIIRSNPAICFVLDLALPGPLQSTSMLRLRELALSSEGRLSFCHVPEGSESIFAPAGQNDSVKIWPSVPAAIAQTVISNSSQGVCGLDIQSPPNFAGRQLASDDSIDQAEALIDVVDEKPIGHVEPPQMDSPEASTLPLDVNGRVPIATRSAPAMSLLPASCSEQRGTSRSSVDSFPDKLAASGSAAPGETVATELSRRSLLTTRTTLLYTATTILAMVLTVWLVFIRPSAGERSLKNCESMYAEIEELNRRKAPHAEWANLNAKAANTLSPAVQRLASKGSNRSLRETHLLLAIRCLFEILESSNTQDRQRCQEEYKKHIKIAKGS